MFVEENGRLTVRDQSGNRIAEFYTVGFYPYRKARLQNRLALLTNVEFSYKGESGGDNHRVYEIQQGGFISCGDQSVAIGTKVNVEAILEVKADVEKALARRFYYRR